MALVTASAMVMGCFTACGNDTPVASSKSTHASESVAVSETPSEEVSAEPVELTYWGALDSVLEEGQEPSFVARTWDYIAVSFVLYGAQEKMY